MNEELIRQCASSSFDHRSWRTIAEREKAINAVVEGIRHYHARHVAPLVEALDQIRRSMRQAAVPGNDWRREIKLSTDLAVQALAPFQQDGSAPTATRAAADVLAERRRQIEAEGWTPEHDDKYAQGELSRAAECYTCEAWREFLGWPLTDGIPDGWPWHPSWWKPAGARRNLVKAGALILAEIERLDRSDLAEPSWQTKADDARAALVVMADNAAEAEKVERVAKAIHEEFARQNVLAYLEREFDCHAIARAALAAMGGEA